MHAEHAMLIWSCRYKKTVICQEVAKAKNVCQVRPAGVKGQCHGGNKRGWSQGQMNVCQVRPAGLKGQSRGGDDKGVQVK